MTAAELRDLFDYTDREQHALIFKFWILKPVFARTDLDKIAKSSTTENYCLLAIRESLFADCVLTVRRLDDDDNRTKSSFRKILKPLLPTTADKNLIAELRSEFTARSTRLDKTFDDLLNDVRNGWAQFDTAAAQLTPLNNKWIAHFELKRSTDGPLAFDTISVGTLEDNFRYLEAIIPIVANLTKDLGELIDLPNLGTAVAYIEGGKQAGAFWDKVSKALQSP